MSTSPSASILALEIKGNLSPEYKTILTPEALEFLVALHRKFDARRKELLQNREQRQQAINEGILPDFLPETAAIRAGDWKVNPLPQDLLDRRVEITGPVDRKMVINALNSGASVFMTDFEDSNSPTWANCIEGQINLRDAVNRTITFTNEQGKEYRLNEKTAVLMVRPRGWHLPEKHILIDDNPASGSLVDFGLFFFHNSKNLIANGSGPYFYLPKLESHLEARLWNDVFVFAQTELGIPLSTTKATVLIETILAAFEMDEILYELREHSAGLNCGRWDYIFSYIKKFRNRAEFLVPDRSQVTMTSPFMRAYSQLVIKTCHKRGVHAMGGMAAQIPVKNDPAANEAALEKVRTDKEREAKDGHDGTWVAHPGLVGLAKEIFDRYMPNPNQIEKLREDVQVTKEDLLEVPKGEITLKGLKTNIDIALQYMEAWISGNGCVPIYNLMEDAATAEISRAQIWHWIRHPKAVLEDGSKITLDLFRDLTTQVLTELEQKIGTERFRTTKFQEAAQLLDEQVANPDFDEFLTLKAYQELNG